MTRLEMDRRQLLKMGISSSVLAVLPLACVRVEEDDASALFERVSNAASPVDPERTGTSSPATIDALVDLCEYVNGVWELAPELDGYLTRLRADLALKTQRAPSYLTEYAHAAQAVDLVTGNSASRQLAWSSLLFSEIASEHPAETKLGRARHFVFSEIITHQVALSGGFKSFGLANYRGAFGGAYTLATSYRRGA